MCVAVGGLVGWQVNAIVADAEVTHSRPRPRRCLKNESNKGALLLHQVAVAGTHLDDFRREEITVCAFQFNVPLYTALLTSRALK